MPSKPIARPAKPVSITEGFNKIKALMNRTPTYNGDGDGFLSLLTIEMAAYSSPITRAIASGKGTLKVMKW